MSALSKLNYVNVGPHGSFKPSGGVATFPRDIDAIFSDLEASGADRLVIHFHGGVIKEATGLFIAEKICEHFKAAAHPVTFVWETSPIETVRNNLSDLYKTDFFQKAVKYVIRHAGKQLGGSIGAKGPGQAMELNEIETELQSLAPFDQYDEGARGAAGQIDEEDLDGLEEEILLELSLDLQADDELPEILDEAPSETDFLDKDLVETFTTEKGEKGFVEILTFAKILAIVAFRVVQRFVQKRDHGFYPTVIEETLREIYVADLVAWLWGGMKKAAQEMWEPNAEPLGEDSHAGTYFLEKLNHHKQNHPNFKIDLSGHSAGSIAICHMLRAAAERFPGLSFRNILFLAPGCSSKLFHEEVVSKPERFEDFRMFTMDDNLETKDHLVPLVYTRSLLYFVSGALEKEVDSPLAGLDRHARGESPYDDDVLSAVHDFLHEPGRHRLVLSATLNAGPGLNSAAATHGGFDDDPVTLDSLFHIISS